MQYKYICLLLKLIFLVAIVKNDAMQKLYRLELAIVAAFLIRKFQN